MQNLPLVTQLRVHTNAHQSFKKRKRSREKTDVSDQDFLVKQVIHPSFFLVSQYHSLLYFLLPLIMQLNQAQSVAHDRSVEQSTLQN